MGEEGTGAVNRPDWQSGWKTLQGPPRLASRPRAVVTRHRSVAFTDIVGSTTIVDERGDEAWLEIVIWHHEMARRLAAESAAEAMQSTGDGVLAVFDSGTRGMAFAVAMVQAVENRPHSEDIGALRLRAGVASGPVTCWAGDYFGRTVHLAARLTTAAQPGQVLVGARLARALTEETADLEEQRPLALRGFDRPEQACAVRRCTPLAMSLVS